MKREFEIGIVQGLPVKFRYLGSTSIVFQPKRVDRAVDFISDDKGCLRIIFIH